jgi:hypothetical protein
VDLKVLSNGPGPIAQQYSNKRFWATKRLKILSREKISERKTFTRLTWTEFRCGWQKLLAEIWRRCSKKCSHIIKWMKTFAHHSTWYLFYTNTPWTSGSICTLIMHSKSLSYIKVNISHQCVDPDPDPGRNGSAFILVGWIRIWIQLPAKEISNLEVLDVKFWRIKTSPVAWTSFMEASE